MGTTCHCFKLELGACSAVLGKVPGFRQFQKRAELVAINSERHPNWISGFNANHFTKDDKLQPDSLAEFEWPLYQQFHLSSKS